MLPIFSAITSRMCPMDTVGWEGVDMPHKHVRHRIAACHLHASAYFFRGATLTDIHDSCPPHPPPPQLWLTRLGVHHANPVSTPVILAVPMGCELYGTGVSQPVCIQWELLDTQKLFHLVTYLLY